ncbi:hypothetical protein Tco_1509202 [Tanacetum coccineum]
MMREEVQTCRNQTTQLNALIAEMEAFDNPDEVFDILMGLRDDVRVEDAKLIGLNNLIAQAEEEIEMKEAQLEVANGFIGNVFQGIVARDAGTLGVLEQYLTGTHVKNAVEG